MFPKKRSSTIHCQSLGAGGGFTHSSHSLDLPFPSFRFASPATPTARRTPRSGISSAMAPLFDFCEGEKNWSELENSSGRTPVTFHAAFACLVCGLSRSARVDLCFFCAGQRHLSKCPVYCRSGGWWTEIIYDSRSSRISMTGLFFLKKQWNDSEADLVCSSADGLL
ncbi:hypothetical protein B0H13DRAFT_2094593 [Mycena leptocephala]|nr:hypothetical protein B0H13DRAFT_2094593 [Mycena leptocephala]